ncbi:probable cytochrome P450 305a1 [Teleopsis dalmanni]|uniref:probable cytochrome P450 305a1 n=1 Tax=Teleopsis dalmanni TaxID=139649 RepID=UPI0018CEC2D2|nr:probable cytochrome P450 305a1 [Teleopsis dalmanni]
MDTFLLIVTFLIGYIIYFLIKSMKRPTDFPPGPQFRPWVGNSFELRKDAIALSGQHMAFENWSKKYNTDILGLKLRDELVVVVLSYTLVHEVHLQEVFEGRPDTFFLRLRTMGTRKGITCTDGKLWYEHRNFAMKQMRHVGYGRTQMEQHIEKECNSLLTYIENTKSEPIWPGTFLAQSVINVLWCLTAGQRIERNDKRLVKLLDLLNRRSKVFDLCGGMLTQFPWLRHIAPDKSGYNLVRQMNEELHHFFMETIEEHKKRLTPENADSDLIFAYIREMNNHLGAENSTFNETQLTMTILDFFIAGSQTTSNTLDLALMMLATRPDIQQTISQEIAANLKFNTDEFPHLSARTFYPYLDAFIMEVQRYFHITPITGPRRALWDTTLGGYNIPKNTTILIGLRSVHMDKTHWGDPDIFRPERFIDSEGKTIKDEYFMPFGQGRRRCLGDALARACIFSFLVKIIQNYKIECAETDKPSLILQPGITLSPKPYKVKFLVRE